MLLGLQSENSAKRALLWPLISLFAIGVGTAALNTPALASVIDKPFLRANAVVIVFGADGFAEDGGQGGIVTDFLLLDSASGTAATDLIAADGVTINFNTERFNPILSGDSSGLEFEITGETFGGAFTSAASHQTLDAADSYTAFGLDDDTDVETLNNGNRASRFYVASNSAFDIYGQVIDVQSTGDFTALDLSNIRYRLRIQTLAGGGAFRTGVDAQDPSVGGQGVVIGATGGPFATLDELDTGAPVKVFDGGRRTAARPGTILSQAVSFQSRYDLTGVGTLFSNYDFSQGIGTLSADVTYTVFTP